ncbi:MAG: hypothetical protein JNN07_12315 [Verrucomicrobiales bacterium]|nr:hypothetical protein [Verrucomicrobiales bacterium]
MKTDDPFERLLAEQSLKPVPSHWRDSILATAEAARSPATPRPQAGLWDTLRFLFCPSPRVAMGLGGVWILIFGLNYLSLPTVDRPGRVTLASSSPVLRLAWLEQQRLRQQLLSEEISSPGSTPSPVPALRPRSARSGQTRVC